MKKQRVSHTVYASAQHRLARISAQKARLVADIVRLRSVAEAKQMLLFSNKKAALLIEKVLASAVANAVHNAGADIDRLRVVCIHVDEGQSFRRFRARARGRMNRIIKRTCHITVSVGI